MKKSYKCDACGEEFRSEKECLEHEKTCMTTENLLRRIRELESRVETLEMMLRMKETYVPYIIPQPPPEYPSYPRNPWTVPPIWCRASDDAK